MRDGFRELAGEDWLTELVGIENRSNGFHELGERIERLADWVMIHGGPHEMSPEEKQLIIRMLRQYIVLGCRAFALGVGEL